MPIDLSLSARDGEAGASTIPRYLQIAKSEARPKLCSLPDDPAAIFLQNAKMEFPEFPNENFVGAWRERANLTQVQLGDRIGTNGSMVSLLESGDRALSPKWLRRISAALGVPIGHLLGDLYTCLTRAPLWENQA